MAKKDGVGEASHLDGAKAGDGLALDAKQGIKQSQRHGDKRSGQGSQGHGSGKTGLARLLEPSNNDDEFGKGTVAEPAELDKIREEQGGTDLGETTLIYGGGYFEREKVGLEDGVSIRDTINANSTEPNYNYDIDPLSGNAPERKVGRANNYAVTGKRGNKFEIGEM